MTEKFSSTVHATAVALALVGVGTTLGDWDSADSTGVVFSTLLVLCLLVQDGTDPMLVFFSLVVNTTVAGTVLLIELGVDSWAYRAAAILISVLALIDCVTFIK